jgi:prepilin-type processing-associated H-X9-DG protein
MVIAPVLSLILIHPMPVGPTPEATLRTVVEGLNKHREDSVISSFVVVEPRMPEVLRKLFGDAKGNKDTKTVYRLESVSVSETGDTAVAKVKLKVLVKEANLNPDDETVKLIRRDGNWKIDNREAPTKTPEGLFGSLGEFLKNPDAMKDTAKKAADATVILSNLKQLALGAILYATDQDEKLNLSTATLKTKLLPYVKSEAIFKAPDGKPLPIVFNSNLTGKRFGDVRRPAETVMMSLGGKGSLVFTDGRTPIAFVDGHVKYLKPDQVSILIWVP